MTLKNKTISVGLLLLAVTLNATVTINIKTSGWGDENSSNVNGLAWGIIVDTDGSAVGGDFSGTFVSDLANALNGFAIPGVSGIGGFSGGSVIFDEYYFVQGRALTSSSGPPTFTDGFMDDLGLTYGSQITAADDYGLLWFSVGSGTLTTSDFFGFQDLGTLPSDGSTIASSTTPGQTLNSITAVPEPSAFALLAGVFGLVMVASRRRR